MDKNAGQPIRSEADGADERVHIKIVDGKAGTAVNKAEVDSDNNVHVEVHGNDPTGTDRAVRLSETGETAIDGTYDGTNNTNPSNIGVVTQERNAVASDSRQTMKPTSIRGTTDTTVVALDVSLHDENGNKYSDSNPLAVAVVENKGEEVHEEDTAEDVAKDGTATHDYTVIAGKKMYFSQCELSGSGRALFVISISLDGTAFTKKFTKRVSASNNNASLVLKNAITIPAGGKVRVEKTNKDVGGSFDLDSTICGVLVDA